MTFARPVVVREVNALPRSEHELTIAHRERDIVPREHGFDVRVGIPFCVTELLIAGHELSEMRDEISLHIGVGVLVHEHSRGRMKHRDDADALGHLRSCDRGTHP